MTFIGLITLNAMMSSMAFEHKFKTQQEDPLVGNDFHARVFGEIANRHWTEFKFLFSFDDSRVTLPSKKVSPN